MELFYRKSGQGEALIILHGLYGSSDNWMNIAKKLSDNHTVYLPDMRNHGKSPHSDIHNFTVMADDVRQFMDSHSIDKAIIIGHSMGGKTAMDFILRYPEKVSKLVVVDIAPKSYLDKPQYLVHYDFHRAVIQSMMAMKLEDYSTREEMLPALRKPIIDKAVRRFLLKNIKRDSEKGFYWQLNLSVLLKNLSVLMDGIDSEKYNDIALPDHPVLFIKGERSDYIMPDDYPDIKTIFPISEIVTIGDAGHWLHAEQTDTFLDVVGEFLDKG